MCLALLGILHKIDRAISSVMLQDVCYRERNWPLLKASVIVSILKSRANVAVYNKKAFIYMVVVH